MEKDLKTYEEVISQTNAYFAALPKYYLLYGLEKLKTPWGKCADLWEDYVEK